MSFSDFRAYFQAGREKDDGMVQEAVLGFSATICFSSLVYECVPVRRGD